MNTECPAPTVAFLTVNRGCNIKCKWCYRAADGHADSMSMSEELATQLVSVIKDLGMHQVRLIGGEPTIWPPLLHFLRYCREIGMEANIISNCVEFGRDAFWKEYLTAPANGIGASMKAANAAEFEQLTGSSRFEDMCLGMRRVFDFHKVGVEVTLNQFMIGRLPEYAQLAMSLGARRLSLTLCHPSLDGDSLVADSIAELESMADYVLEAYDEVSQIMNGHFVLSPSIPLCLWPRDFVERRMETHTIRTGCHVHNRCDIIFDTNGNLLLCNSLFDYPLGQFGKEFSSAESLLALRNGLEVQEYYQGITRQPSMKCADCDLYSECGGGCPLRWLASDPDDLVRGFPSSSESNSTKGGEKI